MTEERMVSPSPFEDGSMADDSSEKKHLEDESSVGSDAVTEVRGVSTASGGNGRETPVAGSGRESTSATAVATTQDPEHVIERPKRPLSAYNMYFRDQREILLRTLPGNERNQTGKGHGKIGFQDLARVIGGKWRDIDPQEKQRYEAIAAEGRAKYLEHCRLWKKQQEAKGLPTTRRKKKAKAKAPTSTTKQSADTQPLAISLSSGLLRQAMPMAANSNADIARGTLSLPPYERNFQQAEIPHQYRRHSMGPRVISSNNYERGNFAGVGLERFPESMQMQQNFSRQSVQGMPRMGARRSFNNNVRNMNDFNGFPQSSTNMMAEYMPTPFQTQSFLPQDYDQVEPLMPMTSSKLNDHYQYDTFHEEQHELPFNGCNMVESTAVLQTSTQGMAQVYDDTVFPFEEEYPMQMPPTQHYHHHHHEDPERLDNLADRMGPDCVDLFVGMFANSN